MSRQEGTAPKKESGVRYEEASTNKKLKRKITNKKEELLSKMNSKRSTVCWGLKTHTRNNWRRGKKDRNGEERPVKELGHGHYNTAGKRKETKHKRKMSTRSEEGGNKEG